VSASACCALPAALDPPCKYIFENELKTFLIYTAQNTFKRRDILCRNFIKVRDVTCNKQFLNTPVEFTVLDSASSQLHLGLAHFFIGTVSQDYPGQDVSFVFHLQHSILKTVKIPKKLNEIPLE
jgi:hypothetical protein